MGCMDSGRVHLGATGPKRAVCCARESLFDFSLYFYFIKLDGPFRHISKIQIGASLLGIRDFGGLGGLTTKNRDQGSGIRDQKDNGARGSRGKGASGMGGAVGIGVLRCARDDSKTYNGNGTCNGQRVLPFRGRLKQRQRDGSFGVEAARPSSWRIRCRS